MTEINQINRAKWLNEPAETWVTHLRSPLPQPAPRSPMCGSPVWPPLTAQRLLRIVLDDWASIGPGFHIYFPGRRQQPTALRLLIDLIREMQPLGI
jgi:hypothetical protein